MNETPVEFNEIPPEKKINWIKEIYEIVDSVVLSAAVVLVLFTLRQVWCGNYNTKGHMPFVRIPMSERGYGISVCD